MGRELFLKQELDGEDITQFIYRKGEKPNDTTPYPKNNYFEEQYPSALNKKVRFSTDGKQLVPLTDNNGIPKLDSAGKQIFIPGNHPSSCVASHSRGDSMMVLSRELLYWNPFWNQTQITVRMKRDSKNLGDSKSNTMNCRLRILLPTMKL